MPLDRTQKQKTNRTGPNARQFFSPIYRQKYIYILYMQRFVHLFVFICKMHTQTDRHLPAEIMAKKRDTNGRRQRAQGIGHRISASASGFQAETLP